MDVSIIVPIYNTERYLDKCIQSILNQTYKNFELILINDGSTDNSIDICNHYKISDDRIVVIDKENTGSSDSRNIGIDKAKGKYICFVDSDDWIDPNMIYDKVKLIKEKNVDFIISGLSIDTVDINGNIKVHKNNYIYSEWNTEELLRNNIIKLFPQALINSSCNKLYNLELIKSNNIKFPSTNIGEDTLFNLSIIKKANGVIITDKIYYHYMKYENITTLTRRIIPDAYERYIYIHKEMINIFKSWNKLDDEVEYIINKTMFSQYFATTLKILRAKGDDYTYKLKKIMLDEGLKNNIIKNTFDYNKAISYKEQIFRTCIKNRLYVISIIFIKLLDYKNKKYKYM